jgi:ESS family glutamate:Na+ symporter
MLKLTSADVLGLAAIALLLGALLRSAIPILRRLEIPLAVVGGTVFSLAGLWLHHRGVTFDIDSTLRDLLAISFFTTVGMGARVSVLRRGGPALLILLALATVGAVAQNLIGIALAKTFGLHPGLGIITGSVTLAGGPSTGLAFGPTFEQRGVVGATSVALASATAGIAVSGLIGNPLALWWMRRRRIDPSLERVTNVAASPVASATASPTAPATAPSKFALALKRLTLPFAPEVLVLVFSIGAGAEVSAWLKAHGVVLPGYVGALVIGLLIRNGLDLAGYPLDDAIISKAGSISLNLFIAMALVGLKLWELSGFALPLLVIFTTQVAFIAFTVPWIWRVYADRRGGHTDFDAIVISTGWVGMMLGITANAVVNMDALVAEYGPATRAFLIVPVVAGFLIDITNAVVITQMLNWVAAS